MSNIKRFHWCRHKDQGGRQGGGSPPKMKGRGTWTRSKTLTELLASVLYWRLWDNLFRNVKGSREFYEREPWVGGTMPLRVGCTSTVPVHRPSVYVASWVGWRHTWRLFTHLFGSLLWSVSVVQQWLKAQKIDLGVCNLSPLFSKDDMGQVYRLSVLNTRTVF